MDIILEYAFTACNLSRVQLQKELEKIQWHTNRWLVPFLRWGKTCFALVWTWHWSSITLWFSDVLAEVCVSYVTYILLSVSHSCEVTGRCKGQETSF